MEQTCESRRLAGNPNTSLSRKESPEMRFRLYAVIVAVSVGLGGCDRPAARPNPEVKRLVLNPGWSGHEYDEIARADLRLGHEDILWLIEMLRNPDPLTRIKAAWVLSRTSDPAAAAALWLACETENDAIAYICLVTSLGRMGKTARPYLVRLLEHRGLSDELRAAIARSEGISWPQRTLLQLQGVKWWRKVGKAKYAPHIPESPPRPSPRIDRPCSEETPSNLLKNIFGESP